MLDAVGLKPYRILDKLYVPRDSKRVRWARNLTRMPDLDWRSGGQATYVERAHAIGVFQTLISIHVSQRENNTILDVGCGTGLVASASEPFIGTEGKYTGIDVNPAEIEFCRGHFPYAPYEFLHLDVHHRVAAPEQSARHRAWPIADASVDLVSAFGVWSNINEEDAYFYLKEVQRVLKPSARAVITCFLMDEAYEQSLATRTSRPGRYHCTPQDRWIFDQPAYGSDAWFHPRWVHTPEMAMGITLAGLDRLKAHAGLELVEQHPGIWKETPGILFHDVLVLEKPMCA